MSEDWWDDVGYAADECLLATPTLRVTRLPRGKIVLRGSDRGLRATLAAAELTMPAVNTISCNDDTLCGWQSPSRVVLLLPLPQQQPLLTKLQRDATGAIVLAAESQFDYIEFAGDAAASCINTGCSLDLRESSFPPGRIAGSLMERMPVTVIRTGDTHYGVLVEHSLAGHFDLWLQSIGRQFS